MHQQTKNEFAVKVITDPAGSNVFRGVARRFGGELWQQDAKTAV
jgi:hypothetical protein